MTLPAYSDIAHELASTRRILARVPDGRFDWAPHKKSMTLGRLATHLAELPRFAVVFFEGDEMDLATSGWTARTLSTTADILALFDENAAAMQAAVAAADGAALGRTWTLRNGDHVILSQQKGALIRTMGISHIVHHRGQLSVYLRLLDVPVPGLYGPSADEAMA